jgi:hypothetical protein
LTKLKQNNYALKVGVIGVLYYLEVFELKFVGISNGQKKQVIKSVAKVI